MLEKCKEYKNGIWLFVITFFVQLCFVFMMKIPYITDEYGTIANAALLSGTLDWGNAYSSSISSYWGYGMSVFYIPIFWLLGPNYNPIILYRAILIINAFFISFIPVIARKIWTLLGKEETKYTWIICLLCGLFPSNVVLSKCAWNESMLIFLIWISSLIVICLILQKHTKLFSALLALIIVFAYATHGRGLIIGISIVLGLILISISSRKNYINFPLFIFVLLISYFIHKQLNPYLLNELVTGTDSVRNTLSQFVSSRNILYLLNKTTIQNLVEGCLGLFYYDFVATLGLIVPFIGVFVCVAVSIILRLRKREENTHILAEKFLILHAGMLFMGSWMLCTYSFSSIYITGIARRREYYIYGRYTETCLSLIVFLTLLYMPRIVRKIGNVITIAGVSFFMLFFTMRYLTPTLIEQGRKTLSYTMVTGIIPFTGIDILSTTIRNELNEAVKIVIFLLFLLVILFVSKRKYLPMIIVGCIFMYSSIFSMVNFLAPSSQKTYNNFVEISDYYKDINQNNTSERLYLFAFDQRVLSLQYMLPAYDITFLNKAAEGYQCFTQVERDSYILTCDDEKLDVYVKDCYYGGMLGRYHLFYYGDSSLKQHKADSYIKRDKSVVATQANTYSVPGGLFEIRISNYVPDANYSIRLAERECVLKGRVIGGELCFTLEANVAANNFIICCNGQVVAQENVKVYVTENQYNEISEMKNFYTVSNIYNVADANTRDNFMYSGKCLKTQTSIMVNGIGTVMLQDIPVSVGSYKICIEGTNTHLLDYSIQNTSGTDYELHVKANNNRTYVYINNSDKAEWITLTIAGHEDMEIMQSSVSKVHVIYNDYLSIK